MDDKTTTNAAVQDTGVTQDVTQPEERPAEADTPTSEPQQPDQEVTEPAQPENPAPQDEDKRYTPDWLASKGIDPSDPDAFEKIANMAFNSEKLMSKSRQQTSKLEENVSKAQPATDAPLSKTDLLVGAMIFKQNNPITTDQDNKMGDYITNNPDKWAMMQHGLLTYEDVFAMSGAAALGTADPTALKTQGGQEALQTLASKQRATAPKGNASTPTTPKTDDPFLAGFNKPY